MATIRRNYGFKMRLDPAMPTGYTRSSDRRLRHTQLGGINAPELLKPDPMLKIA